MQVVKSVVEINTIMAIAHKVSEEDNKFADNTSIIGSMSDKNNQNVQDAANTVDDDYKVSIEKGNTLVSDNLSQAIAYQFSDTFNQAHKEQGKILLQQQKIILLKK